MFPAGKSAITIVRQILLTDAIAIMNVTVTNKGGYKYKYRVSCAVQFLFEFRASVSVVGHCA